MNLQTRARVVCLAAVAVVAVLAQGKRPLNLKDADNWRSISNQRISRDGRYVAYALFPQEGDGEVVVRDLATGQERRENAGERPPAPPGPSSETPEEERSEPRGVRVEFTADSRFVVFATYPTSAEIARAKKEKKKPEEAPKGGIAIMDLASGVVTRIPRAASFQVPEKGSGFIACWRGLEKTEEKKTEGGGDQRSSLSSRARGRVPAESGDLLLAALATGRERVFTDVVEYSLTKDARALVYTVSAKKKEEANGVYAVKTGGEDTPVALLAGKGRYVRLAWDEKQTRLAWLSDRDDTASRRPKMKLYLWERNAPAAKELASNATPGLRDGFTISERGNVSFSRDGRKVFFGCAPAQPAVPSPSSSEERAVYDLWHWRDDFIQPMQKVRARQERERTYRVVFHLEEGKLVQLADQSMAEVAPSGDGRWAVGSDDREYRRMVEYDERYRDYYLVDTLSGDRKPIARKHGGTPSWSPDGRHAALFDGRHWSTVEVPSATSVNLTAKLGVPFFNEDNDRPNTPSPYGLAGWTKDGQHLLVYDRFDIWQLAADGALARNMTGGAGRKLGLQFRAVRLSRDPEEAGIDPAQPLLARAENLTTRETGFWRVAFGGETPPEKLIMAARNFGTPVKAEAADRLLVTAQRFDEFPDLHVAGSSLADLRKVSDANPQKAQLLWGAAELVNFRNLDGVALSGILVKPENFDPRRKYPLLVYIYERLSQNLHNFVDPRPSHRINAAHFASNGYLVFMPDIVYTIGWPGQSALKCVLAGVEAVAARGFVDEQAIGIQGHSWGGYQIAYMVTQTTRFRVAAPGALVANMTSAYDGIRWGPGLPRQFQYERAQSRIGGSLWQYPIRFLENSPIFMADRVKAPLLMLHNDADDAVPWYQGIEYYLALRRLGKEVYMFVYNGEPHGLRKRPNQKDYSMRLQQFFDHYLKGAPKPDWMERGRPYLERERETPETRPSEQ